MTNSVPNAPVDRGPLQTTSSEHKLVDAADDKARRHSSLLVTDTVSSEELVSIFAVLGDKTVTLNVGGVMHKTYYRTLARCPGTRLFGLAYQQAVSPDVQTAEIFFDNDPDVFTSVLDYYRYGELPLLAFRRFVTETLKYLFMAVHAYALKHIMCHPCSFFVRTPPRARCALNATQPYIATCLKMNVQNLQIPPISAPGGHQIATVISTHYGSSSYI